MNKKLINNISKTDWERVDALTEEEIDTSDIPPLTEELFSQSKWWKPIASLKVVVQVASHTLAWFQSQGEDYEKKMAAALQFIHRIYT